MRRPTPLPSSLRGRPFSTREAVELRIGSARLARRDLAAPFHGVRAPADADFTDLHVRCRAYSQVMPTHHCFSHTTAAELYGIVLPSRLRDSRQLHVAAVDGGRAPRGTGVIGHSLALGSDDLTVLSNLRVPRVGHVFCQLASDLTFDELVIAGDSCLRRRTPLATRLQLETALRTAAGRRGSRTLRAAMALVRAGTDSPKESELRLGLLRAGLPEPSINVELHTAAGITFHGDLVYPGHRVLVEYDGEHHWTDARQRSADVDRLWMLEQEGWRILHFDKGHMRNGAAVAVARVRAALEM